MPARPVASTLAARSAQAALSCLVALGLVSGCGAPTSPPGTGEAGDPATPAGPWVGPQLEEGTLAVAWQSPDPGRLVRRRAGGQARAAVTDDRIVWLGGDDRLIALDRRTGEVAWQQQLPADTSRDDAEPYGACWQPMLSPESTTVTLAIGFECRLVVTYDLAEGRLLSTRRTAHQLHEVASLHGRLWWASFDAVGYIDDEGTPQPVVTGEDDLATTLIFSLSVLPEHDLLIADVKDQELPDGDFTKKYVGVQVDGLEAEKAWETPQTAAGLGVPLAPGEPVIDIARPGVDPVLLAKAPQGVHIGAFDPETGRMTAVVTNPSSRGSLRVYDKYDFARVFCLVGDLLLTANDTDVPADVPVVVALDRAAGKETWRKPGGSDHTRSPAVEAVSALQTATDGTSAYAVDTTDGLTRFDAATGEVTGYWTLPGDEVSWRAEIQVVDDLVLAFPREHAVDDEPARLTVLRSS